MSLTMAQAAKRLGVSAKTIQRRIEAGEIKAFKLGDSKNSPVRILEESLIEYVNRCTINT